MGRSGSERGSTKKSTSERGRSLEEVLRTSGKKLLQGKSIFVFLLVLNLNSNALKSVICNNF